MYVELRTPQRKAAEAAVRRHAGSIDELVVYWLEQGTPVTPTTWAAMMPAIGWRMVMEALAQDSFGRDGRGKGRPRGATVRALKAVARAVNLRETHPALTGQGVLGEHVEHVPAWRSPTGEELSPYPEVGGTFQVMVPDFRESGIGVVTRWMPQRHPAMRSAPLYDPASHWAFTQPAHRTSH